MSALAGAGGQWKSDPIVAQADRQKLLWRVRGVDSSPEALTATQYTRGLLVP